MLPLTAAHISLRRPPDPKVLASLAKIFSGAVLRQIAQTGRSDCLSSALRTSSIASVTGPDASLRSVIATIFALLRKHYRSDYVYRTAILNKIFLGRHSPNTTMLLPEFRVLRNKADIVMLNGTSTVFEIKSNLDNLSRLSAQIKSYSRVFDKMYVVTDETQIRQVQSVVPDNVGIIVLTKLFTLRYEKQASPNKRSIDIPSVVDALRLPELIALTESICGATPKATNVTIVKLCLHALEKYRPEDIHAAMLKILMKRKSYSANSFNTVPGELAAAYLESGISASRWGEITKYLDSVSIGEFQRGGFDASVLPVFAREKV
jgi:hypothetical protein